MITINPESRDDCFYRYKMPIVEISYFGKNSNFETKIDNLKEISNVLNRNPNTLFKYIIETICTASITKNDTYIIKGSYKKEYIQTLIDNYIKDFVLCETCSNPETYFNVNNKKLYINCNSCGKNNSCNIMTKTSKYILNSL